MSAHDVITAGILAVFAAGMVYTCWLAARPRKAAKDTGREASDG